jgi:phosphoglucosamine mutase
MTTLFGTDGIRGRVGEDIFVQEKLLKLGGAFAQWAQEQYGTNPHILLIHDTRISCSYIKSALKTSLLRHPITLYDGGVLPTPAALHILQENVALHCALVISASHNPYQDNGIKIFDKKGKITEEHEQKISALFLQNHHDNYEFLGQEIIYTDAEKIYCNRLKKLFSSLSLHSKKIVLDVAQGATYRCAQKIFKSLGARVIMINNKPNGRNINQSCGTLALASLQKAVVHHHADIGFAFDGDGDRLMAVNSQGIIKDGDDILAVLSEHPLYAGQNTLVGTLMTNSAFENYLRSKNKSLWRTSVGDKYIIEYLLQHNLLLGGEQSGHIILQDILSTGDGIAAALRLIETLYHTHNWELETFNKYPQLLINIHIKHKKDLTLPPYASIIAQAHQNLSPGRLLVRYSGTEPILRIMAESEQQHATHTIGSEVAENLKNLLEFP